MQIDPIACSGVSLALEKFFIRLKMSLAVVVVLSGLQQRNCISTAFPFI